VTQQTMCEWPDAVPGLEWLSSMWGDVILRFAPPFDAPPDLLVVHSGARANWIAEYLHNPICPVEHVATPRDATKATDGCRLVDGRWYRVAAAHICWYAGAVKKLRPTIVAPEYPNTFVQQSSLRRSVPGAGGGSVCQGLGGVNSRSIHVELPARPINVEIVHLSFRALIEGLTGCLPSLQWWTTHREIDSRKTDPVSTTGWSPRWMDGMGLQFAPR